MVTRGTKIDNRFRNEEFSHPLFAIEGERGQARRAAIKKAFAEIKSSEDRLRTILDAIPAQVWSQRPDGTINYVNRRWREYTGLSYGAGGNGESVPPVSATDVGQAIVHPDDLPSATAKFLDEILPTGKPGEFELRLRRHDGEYRWLDRKSVV